MLEGMVSLELEDIAVTPLPLFTLSSPLYEVRNLS
jgi:hypothetical protein